jgi:hypothetical protein
VEDGRRCLCSPTVSRCAGQRRAVAIPAALGGVEEISHVGRRGTMRRGGKGRQRGPRWRLHDRQGRGKRRGSSLRGVRGAAWSSGRKWGSGARATVGSVAREQGRAHGVQSGEREAGAWARPVGQSKMNRAIFYLLNIFSTNSNFKCFKECLPMVENFQIKCGFVWN